MFNKKLVWIIGALVLCLLFIPFCGATAIDLESRELRLNKNTIKRNIGVDINRFCLCDNIEQMRAADFSIGHTVATKGYYDINDGGAGCYSIRSKNEDDVDNGGSIIFLNNGNVAALIHDGSITIKQFGARGDGVTNDAPVIQKAMNAKGIFHVELEKNKVYYINSIIYLTTSNRTLDLNGSKIIKGAATFRTVRPKDTTFGYNGPSNITIKNGTLVSTEILLAHGENLTFENLTFLNSTGHCFQIMSCKNVVIRNCLFRGMRKSTSDNLKSFPEVINLDPCDHIGFPFYDKKDNPSYDGTNNNYILIENNRCEPGIEKGFEGDPYLGVSHHYCKNSYHDHVTIRHNYMKNNGTRPLLSLMSLRYSKIYNNYFDGYAKNFIVVTGAGEDVSIYNNRAYNRDIEEKSGKFVRIFELGCKKLSIYNNALLHNFSDTWLYMTKTGHSHTTFKRIDLNLKN